MPDDLIQLSHRWTAGETDALADLFPCVVLRELPHAIAVLARFPSAFAAMAPQASP